MKKIFVVFMCIYMPLIYPVFEQFNAWRFYKKDDLVNAQRYLDAALIKDSEDFQSLYNSGKIAYKEGNFSKSEAYFKAASDTEDRQLKEQSFFDLGNSQVRQEKLEDAAQSFEQVLEINQNNEYAQKTLDEIRKRLEQKQQQDNQQQDQKNNKQDQKNDKDDQSNQNDDQQSQDSQKQQDENKGDQGSEQQEPSEQRQDQQPQNKEEQSGQQSENKSDKGSSQNNEQSPNESPNHQSSQSEKQEDQGQQSQESNASKGQQPEPSSEVLNNSKESKESNKIPDKIAQFLEALEQEDKKNAKKMLQHNLAQESSSKRNQKNW